MNTIVGELGKNPKFCEYIKNIENNYQKLLTNIKRYGIIYLTHKN